MIFPFGRMIPANAFLFYVFEVPQHDYATSTYILFGGDKPLDPSRKKPEWQLTEAEQAIIHSICGPEMKAYGVE